MSGSKAADLKVVLLGHQGVGKTCLVVRYCDSEFSNTSPTLGASFVLKVVSVGGRKMTLGIWDTAGQERFDCLSSFYCRGAGAALLCFDLTSQETFERVPKWVKKLPESGADENCLLVLVGTKSDLVESNPNLREVDPEAAESYAKSIGAIYLETSAKTGINIDKVFESIAEHYITNLSKETTRNRGPSEPISLDGDGSSGRGDGGGCAC
eukprot:TRINITY_DN1131_c0_g1_i1.p1 TRINITY_DN1131_c0_g1~~TRINITY_DN1131_c0_g1_i1.p1  ORF type:complete len:210 (+),score=5.49 TRINITY_DN1131_c0_g1_i1:229-858(+)